MVPALEVRLVAAGGEACETGLGEVLLGPFDHRNELVDVAGLAGDLGGEHDLVLLVDDGLGVLCRAARNAALSLRGPRTT